MDMSLQQTTYSALLGQIIGSLRQQKGEEQAVLAKALGVSQASYSRLEGGKANWNIDQFIVACNRLGVEVTDVIQILEQRVSDLAEAAGVEVIAAGRANSKGAEERKSNGGAFVVGAALGALMTTLVLKK